MSEIPKNSKKSVEKSKESILYQKKNKYSKIFKMKTKKITIRLEYFFHIICYIDIFYLTALFYVFVKQSQRLICTKQ